MIKLVISGCCGKMGRRIIALSLGDSNFELAGAIENKAHPAIGKKLSEALGIPGLTLEVKDNPGIIKGADVLIEFSNPSATVEHLTSAVKHKKAVVIGTTGLSPEQAQKVKEASRDIPVVFSPNMSLGVNLVFRLVKEAAQKLGRDYKVDIVEAHHIHKKDAPSGTAKRLAELIKESSGREKEKIEIDSVREGEIVGDHQVRFNGPRDTIIIKHSAKTRDIFARGALEAAKFAAKQPPGLYDMQNVIG
ncbi:MAG: 4-hydroxy-tetrahydrodipicolinate reductase [Candidatus Omnitrophica bacterium]|nr:4-hydroxy-tetrahydrodipicolinate reductase [Candidatus Omnitrophota bacterium]MBU3933628.1 4-hydroxy-tetrahydrodipicolinate reductase [Candidatus Omnitrophota bacterium]